jgi:TonB family protein
VTVKSPAIAVDRPDEATKEAARTDAPAHSCYGGTTIVIRLQATFAAAAMALLAGAGPALAADTAAGTAMMIADIGRDVDALANTPHTDARIVRAAYAELPDFERIAGIGGTVRVAIGLGADGHLTDSHVITASGHPRLDQNALRAVRAATYAPATVAGRPVGGTYEVDVNFASE